VCFQLSPGACPALCRLYPCYLRTGVTDKEPVPATVRAGLQIDDNTAVTCVAFQITACGRHSLSSQLFYQEIALFLEMFLFVYRYVASMLLSLEFADLLRHGPF
jgi:hypothetical protein